MFRSTSAHVGWIDEDVGPADVLVDLERALRVGEALKTRMADRHAEELGDLGRQRRMRTSRKQLQLARTHSSTGARSLAGAPRPRRFLATRAPRAPSSSPVSAPDVTRPCRTPARSTRDACLAEAGGMVGAEGFEPSNTGSKVPRLTSLATPQKAALAPGTLRSALRARLQRVKCSRSLSPGSNPAHDRTGALLVFGARQRPAEEGCGARP